MFRFNSDFKILPCEVSSRISFFFGLTFYFIFLNHWNSPFVVEQNISLISQLNSDCLLMEKGVLTKKLNASEINSVEKARDLLSLHN